MTNTPLTPSQQLQDRFGRQVAARLAAGAAELPYDVTERLRAARMQALARRKLVSMQRAPALAAAGGVTLGDEPIGLWNRIGSALPLVALVAGLILIHTVEDDRRASELAEVDAALLTDDLPPSAYADPGFAQFVKSGRE
jgi:hypothetical protein